MTPLDQQVQLFASAGAIKFPYPESAAWMEKVYISMVWFFLKCYFCSLKLIGFSLSFQINRLNLLLTVKESAMDVPSNLEARRRISFFSNSLFMNMPNAPKVRNMLSFS